MQEAKAQLLLKQFEYMAFLNGEFIDDFAVSRSLVAELHGLGENIEEVHIVKKLLQVVSMKFNQVAYSIEMLMDHGPKERCRLRSSLGDGAWWRNSPALRRLQTTLGAYGSLRNSGRNTGVSMAAHSGRAMAKEHGTAAARGVVVEMTITIARAREQA